MAYRVLSAIGLTLGLLFASGCDSSPKPASDTARQEPASPDPGVLAAPSLDSEKSQAAPPSQRKAALPATAAPVPSAGISEQVRTTVAEVMRTQSVDVRDDLRQLILALHNFHDVHTAFPATDGIGQEGTASGLSWRVHLLPYLEQADLYNEFHRDEPWDSEHNLALVKRMPKIFGSDPEGKTRFQVYTGTGGSFQTGRGLRLANITDGTSNTIAIVHAGPEAAEIWTKPGGLTVDAEAPWKSLGNVGDRVSVGMFDGSVRLIPTTIAAAQWRHLLDPKDGNLIGEIPSGGAKPGPKAMVSKAELPPLGPPKDALDLTFIPETALATVVLQPRRLLETPLVQKLMNSAPARPGASPDLPTSERILPTNISDLMSRMGVSLEQIEEVRLIVDGGILESVQEREPPLASFGLVVRASVPWQVQPVIAEYLGGVSHPETQDVAGLALAVDGDSGLGLGFLNERQLILGGTSVIEKMLAARDVDSEVTQRMHAVGDRAFVMAVDLSSLRTSLTRLEQLPPQAFLIMPFLMEMQGLTLSLDLTHAELASLSASFQKPEAAEGLFAMLDGQFQAGQAQYENSRESLKTGATASLVPILDELVNGAKLVQADGRISFSIKRPDKFDDLPTALEPALEEARRANDAVMRRNNLKMIALAMHNFESAFSHFPALDGMGDAQSSMKGKLSWRVYLLPFLDQNALYQEFHLDEDWDSEHNRTLISRMPVVYGENPEGKTRIQMFTGPGCPFTNGNGIRPRDITDGMSNVLMAVEAGPDTAEVWTKPGGLAFDPNDPLRGLGTLTEPTFLGMMFDGSVRTFGKTLSAETLRRLFQHNDGAPITD